jgi:hypothetical protein
MLIALTTKAGRDDLRRQLERGEAPGIDDVPACLALLQAADEADRLRDENPENVSAHFDSAGPSPASGCAGRDAARI